MLRAWARRRGRGIRRRFRARAAELILGRFRVPVARLQVVGRVVVSRLVVLGLVLVVVVRLVVRLVFGLELRLAVLGLPILGLAIARVVRLGRAGPIAIVVVVRRDLRLLRERLRLVAGAIGQTA
jgi:hypothetical protein